MRQGGKPWFTWVGCVGLLLLISSPLPIGGVILFLRGDKIVSRDRVLMVVWTIVAVGALLSAERQERRKDSARVEPDAPPPPRAAPPPPAPVRPVKMDRAAALVVLGLPSSFTAEQLKAAFRKAMLSYHPDRVADLGAELREVAERRSKEINQAYDLLSGG